MKPKFVVLIRVCLINITTIRIRQASPFYSAKDPSIELRCSYSYSRFVVPLSFSATGWICNSWDRRAKLMCTPPTSTNRIRLLGRTKSITELGCYRLKLSNFTVQLISISDSTQTKLCIGLQFQENTRFLLSKWNCPFNRRVCYKGSKMT